MNTSLRVAALVACLSLTSTHASAETLMQNDNAISDLEQAKSMSSAEQQADIYPGVTSMFTLTSKAKEMFADKACDVYFAVPGGSGTDNGYKYQDLISYCADKENHVDYAMHRIMVGKQGSAIVTIHGKGRLNIKEDDQSLLLSDIKQGLIHLDSFFLCGSSCQ